MNIYVGLLILIVMEYVLICKSKVSNYYSESQWYAIKKKRKKLFLIIACFEMTLLATLRDSTVGADTLWYVEGFEYYKSLPHEQIIGAPYAYPYDWEEGYRLFCQIFAWLGVPYTLFLGVIAAIVYVVLFYKILKCSDSPLLSLIIYVALGIYGYSLGIIRQMMAMSICLLSLKYIKEKKLLPFLGYILIAVWFHTSAICWLPLFFLVKYFDKIRKFYLWILPFTGIMLAFGRDIINIIIRFFPQYEHYVGGKYDKSGGSYLMLLLLFVVYVLVYLYIRKEDEYSFLDKIAVLSLPMAMIIQSVSYSMTFFSRVVPYYSIFLIVLVPRVLNKLFGRNIKQWVYLAAYVCFGLLALYQLSSNYINPYLFFWQ